MDKMYETLVAGLENMGLELNDETWADFCEQVKALGVDELVQIWQTAADNQR